ncbi:Csa1 family protein, partial [Staphylococcus aureus]
NDKGTWTISSEMAIQKKGEALNIKGMVLKLNRNARSAKGFYYVNAIKKDENGRPLDNQIEYPDKEGYRDDEFDKNDKGTWTISSEMAIQKKGEALNIKGMVLKLNR